MKELEGLVSASSKSHFGLLVALTIAMSHCLNLEGSHSYHEVREQIVASPAAELDGAVIRL